MPRLTGSQLNITSLDDAKRAIKALSDNVPSPEMNTIQTSGDGGIGELQQGTRRQPFIVRRRVDDMDQNPLNGNGGGGGGGQPNNIIENRPMPRGVGNVAAPRRRIRNIVG